MMGSLVLSQGMRAQCFRPERGRRRGDERLVVFAAPFLYAPFLTRECRINSDVSVDNTYQRDTRAQAHELLRNDIAIDTAINFHNSPHSEATPLKTQRLCTSFSFAMPRHHSRSRSREEGRRSDRWVAMSVVDG